MCGRCPRRERRGELKDAGFTAQELKGIPAPRRRSWLKGGGFTAQGLKDAGFAGQELGDGKPSDLQQELARVDAESALVDFFYLRFLNQKFDEWRRQRRRATGPF
jgi:hypothetical protein